MPRLIALEWDDAEARVAVADVRRGSMTLEQAFSVALPGGLTPNSAAASEVVSASGAHDLGAIGRRIGEALLARGVRRSKTLVAVGRANIELKNLTLPPSPPDELPELVRFQAEREFNALGDDWPLDYIPQPGAPGEPQTVLAAAISPELVGEIESTCQAAGVMPERLVLRPCAAASLLSRIHPAEEKKLRLLVDLLADEADLTVLAGDTVVFLRTARLPHELLESDPLRALLPEIRRTIAAVQNRFQGQYITEVFLCGAGDDQEMLVREIGRDLNLPAELFNPLTCCPVSSELQRNPPGQPSRFAPLVGMLLDESAGGAAVIDFLNPRQKPKKQSQQRKFAVPAIAAATLLFVVIGWTWLRLFFLDGEIAALAQTSNSLDAKVKAAQGLFAEARQIEDWLSGDITWLDELALMSEKAPPAQEVMLTKITHSVPITRANPLGNKGPSLRGTVHIDGVARTRGIAEQLQRVLRDGGHEVTVPSTTQQEDAGKYPWLFNADLKLTVENTLSGRIPAAAKTNTGKTNPPLATPIAKPDVPTGEPADKKQNKSI
jgi:Tfp pilus assembly PilM family ATPase